MPRICRIWWILLFVNAVLSSFCPDYDLQSGIQHDVETEICINLTSELQNCWHKSTSVTCKGLKPKRPCLNDIALLLEECMLEETAEYVDLAMIRIIHTDHTLCQITSHPDFNPSCWERARWTSDNQAHFLLDGYDTLEGCKYTTVFSLLSDAFYGEDQRCTMEMNLLRSAWFDLEPCYPYKSIRKYLFKPEYSGNISSTCLQSQARLDECFWEFSKCRNTEVEMIECFESVRYHLRRCNEEVLILRAENHIRAMQYALDFLCNSDCSAVLKNQCWKEFTDVTYFVASSVMQFHSRESCKNRKMYLDHLVATTKPFCHDLMFDFTEFMWEEVNCFNGSDKRQEPFHDSGQNNNETIFLLLISIVIYLLLFFNE